MTLPQKQLWNACLGNFFEHYDTALFGLLSPFLAPLIFPEHDQLTALILTYAIIPLGMLARPLGSLFFGYIGDVYGRNHALFLTLAGMSIVSACIALSPTYAQAGIISSIIFTLGRILQNFLAAGETMGGAIFLLENSPNKRHDLLSGLYGASSMGGHLLASFGVLMFSSYNAIDFGWRHLYLYGCVTAFFGCMIRNSSQGIQAPAQQSKSISSMKEQFWKYRKQLLLIIINSGFTHATYAIALVLMNGIVPLVSSVSKTEIMEINTYLLILDFCALPFFGWIASKVSREKLMLFASLGVIIFAVPLFMALQGASLAGIIGIRIAFVLLGVAFCAPLHAWAQMLVPPTCRYEVISFGYAIGSQLLGGPTAVLALWCYQKTGMISSVSWYWIFLATASCITMAISLRSGKTFQWFNSDPEFDVETI